MQRIQFVIKNDTHSLQSDPGETLQTHYWDDHVGYYLPSRDLWFCYRRLHQFSIDGVQIINVFEQNISINAPPKTVHFESSEDVAPQQLPNGGITFRGSIYTLIDLPFHPQALVSLASVSHLLSQDLQQRLVEALKIWLQEEK